MTEATDDGRAYGAEGGKVQEPAMQGTTEQKIDPWCDLCYDETGQETDATGFCPECNSFLCHSCIKAHSKMPTLRNHLIKRGTGMPSCQSEKPVKYPYCTSHVGKVNDQFCLDHGIMKCSQCIEDTHILCGTGAISDLCKIIDSEDFLIIKEIVRCIYNISVSTKTNIERNIDDIKNKKSQLRREVEELRDKIIAQVKEDCSDIITKINSTSDHNLSVLAEHVVLLSDIDHCLDKTLSEIEKKANAICEPNLFIRMQEIVGHVARCRNKLEDIKKQLHTTELSFSPSAEMSAFISGTCQLGELRKESKEPKIMIPQSKIAFPQLSDTSFATAQRTKHDISSITESMSGGIDVKLDDDLFSCDVYGMDATKNGNIILADFANKKVKTISADNKLLSCQTFSSSPTDVSILNRLTAAVGTLDGKLQMINISDVNSVSVQKTIDLGYCVIATSRYDTNIVIARWDKLASVKMLAVDGKEIWSVSTDSMGDELFENPFSVARNTTPTVTVTDWGKNTHTLLDASNGKHIRTSSVDGSAPLGLTVDKYGNIYVCFFLTKDIYVWSSDLQQRKILLPRDRLQGKPRAVCYRNSTDTLFVSYANMDRVDCFQLLYN